MKSIERGVIKIETPDAASHVLVTVNDKYCEYMKTRTGRPYVVGHVNSGVQTLD